MKARFQIDRLKVLGKITSREEIFKKSVDAGQLMLQQAKLNKTPALCLCIGEDKPITMTTVTTEAGVHIRRMPKQGSKHHQTCLSYGGINERAEELYTDDAIYEKGEHIHLSLDGPLSEMTVDGFKDDETVVRAIKASWSIRRSSMTILELLNYLWEEAGLNVWWPKMDGKRRSWVVRSATLAACEGRTFKGGRSLSEFMFFPQTTKGARDGSAGVATDSMAQLIQHLKHVEGAGAENEQCYGIVIGEVGRVIDPRPGQRSLGIVLREMTGPMWDNHGVIKRLDKSFPHSMARLRARQAAGVAAKSAAVQSPTSPRAVLLGNAVNDYRLIGIFAVGLSKNRESVVLKQGAVMETSARYIPVASDCEGQVERKLYGEGRAFEKPLVYDGERWAFPDFILIDTDHDPRPVLEVYGFSGDEYEARKRAKHVEYVRTRTPYWHWDLKQRRDIPGFDCFPVGERFRKV